MVKTLLMSSPHLRSIRIKEIVADATMDSAQKSYKLNCYLMDKRCGHRAAHDYAAELADKELESKLERLSRGSLEELELEVLLGLLSLEALNF